MLSEGRKRDTAANALLALSFAANAAQSPKDLIRSGHVEGPGIQLMSRMMSKRKEADRNLDHGRVVPRNVKKKTFKEFVEIAKLCESSRLFPRGPAASRSDRNKQRQDRSNRAALAKAGFSRSPRPVTGSGSRKTKWTETSVSSHHGTETATHANQSDYAAAKIGNVGTKGNIPTSQRALKAKKIKQQLGGDRTSKPIHDVAVNKSRNDDASIMARGRSFKKEVTKGVSDNLKKVGAKPGDLVTSTPTSSSRSRMYGRTHNTKTSKRTGITVNRVS